MTKLFQKSSRRGELIAILCFCILLLILLHSWCSCLPRADDREDAPFRPRAGFLSFPPPLPKAPSSQFDDGDNEKSGQLIGDEKRTVHTGPNPLHNR